MSDPTTRTRDDTAAPPEDLCGTMIGRYLLLRELGSGGSGVVWAALDPQLDREVAIKLLREPARDRDVLISEARLLARLHHPHVVTVHDAGRAADRVYLVMELVGGDNAAAWLRAGPRTEAERVRLIIEAGQGLASAHAAGIVHRDYKPSNILVDRRGSARVTDFGLGVRASEQADAGECVPDGTPLYLAPERYAGSAADPRSDQYSYCLSSIEMLTGSLPFKSALDDEAALLDAKRAERFDAEILERVPRALRSILRRGIAADPADRWSDVATVAEAIAATRRRRWRWPIAVAVVAGVATLVAAWALGQHSPSTCDVPGVRGIDRALSPARLAAYRQRMLADPARASLWHPIEAAVREVRDGWNRRYDATCGVRGAEQADAQRVLVCLEDRATELDAELGAIEASPDATLAQSTAWIGEARHRVSECDRPHAIKRGDRALRKATDEAAWLRRAGRWTEALALAISTAERAVAAGDDVELAAALHEAASSALVGGDPDSAARHADAAHLAALRANDQIAATATALVGGQIELARTRYAEAASWLGKAEAYLTRLAPDGRDRKVADLLGARAQLASARGNQAEAIARYREEVTLREQLFGEASIDGFPARLELGHELAASGALPEAIETLTRTLAIAEAGFGPTHPSTAAALDGLADPLLRRGDHDRAIALWLRAAEILHVAYGPHEPRLAAVYANLAVAYQAKGNLDAASEPARQALAIRRAIHPDHPKTGAAMRTLARLEGARGRHEAARALAEEARALAVRTVGARHPDVATSLRVLGTMELHQQRWGNCRDRFAEAIAIQEQLEGGVVLDLLEAHSAHAWCAAQLGQLVAARDELRDVVERARAKLPAEHPRVLWFRYRYAELLRRSGKQAEANAMFEELLPAIREAELRRLVEGALGGSSRR